MEHHGFSSSAALYRLRDEVLSALDEYRSRERSLAQARGWSLLRIFNALSLGNQFSPYFWPSALLTLCASLAYLVAYCSSSEPRFSSLIGEWFIITLSICVNIFVTVWITNRRAEEIRRRCEFLAKRLAEFAECVRWKREDYPNLFTPLSPCIAIQWTCRDGMLVNIPWALLVAGDIILLKPGQEVPGRCVSCDEADAEELALGDVFAPQPEEDGGAGDHFNVPRMRVPSTPKPYRLLETPVMNSIRFALNNPPVRPLPVFQQERKMIISNMVEKVIIPLIFVTSMGVNAYRCFHLTEWSGPWAEMLLVLPTVCILPLLALTFPCFLAIGNLIGTARILATFHVLAKKRSHNETTGKLSAASSFEDVEAGEAVPMVSSDDDDEPLTSKIRKDLCNPAVEAITLKDVFRQMMILLGFNEPEDTYELPGLWLSSSLLHVLGSASSLCCIDKKGILSWPNPVADKVFFFHHARQSATDSEANQRQASAGRCIESPPSSVNPLDEDGLACTEGESSVNALDGSTKSNSRKPSVGETSYTRRGSNADSPATHAHLSAEDSLEERPVVPEVLDLYLDPSKPFHLQFDDPSIGRGRHLKSLKPLGLAALLNTCNPHTQNHYAHFCAHITAQAMNNEVLVPVTNRSNDGQGPAGRLRQTTRTALDLVDDLTRGCLCELAHQIGFTEHAVDGYELCDQLATFRHVEASLVQRSRLAKSMSTAASARLKFPFPHMVGVVVKEPEAGGCQLLSQGTADIVLDSCSDLWDGQDLVPLNDVLRKKILDFYHRSSLTAYCTAFSYCPILFPLGGDVSSKYLELPPEGHKVNYSQSPTAIVLHPEFFGNSGSVRKVSASYMSTDSLSPSVKPEDSCSKDQAGNPMSDATSAWACLMAQSQQVFLGMVTMQYQARPPLVQLVENLETACIRFVHFSKENELRSRVFSEKMGLESGWNCHVSLLSDSKTNKSAGPGSCEDALIQQTPDRSCGAQRRRSSCRKERRASALEGSKAHSFSAPSVMNQLAPPEDEEEDPGGIFEFAHSKHAGGTGNAVFLHPGQSMSDVQLSEILKKGSNAMEAAAAASTVPAIGDNNQAISVSQESSHFTDSTEQTAPVPFDMSNRAKLPRGIENIRPHLVEVDNVPLLVSLFTDCTPSACEEMIRIMQENDQVVCVLGSTASAHNTVIFLQADAALGVEPLYPQVCMKVPSIAGNEIQKEEEPRIPQPGPADISHMITSLPCALSFRSGQPLVIFDLILEARNFMKNSRTALQFWLCASGAISLLMFLSYCCLLPPVLKSYHVLLLGSAITPLFAAGLIANPLDGRVMKTPTGKLKTNPDADLIIYVIRFYGMKFIPSVFVILAFFAFTLYESCPEWHSATEDPNGTLIESHSDCVFVYRRNISGTHVWGGWTGQDSPEAADFLSLAQNLAAFLVALYCGVISVAFVHRMDQVWERSPLRNRLWFTSMIVGIVTQGLICTMDVSLNGGFSVWFRLSLPVWLWCAVAIWPIVLLAINEFVKRREIWLTGRHLKRARLEFGTKLGMNSPF